MQAKEVKKEVEVLWDVTSKVINVHPETFNIPKITKELFTYYYHFIISRCFGYGLPTTMIVPVIDMFNH